MPEALEFILPTTAETKISTEVKGNLHPEVIANSPLENISLVYSVPVMGEWKNGNLQRMLQGMFSQRPNKGEAFEVEVIANIGSYLDELLIIDYDNSSSKNYYKQDEQGRFVLETEPKNEKQKKALDLLDESSTAIGFLKQVVEAQRLARLLKGKPKDKNNREDLEKILKTSYDPLQNDILRLAVAKANEISLAVIDATHSAFRETEYGYASLSSLRTLGADIALTRFEDHQEIALCMYDADTVPENNNAVKDLQQIFEQHPDLNYLFTGMAYLPAGHSREFVADSPRQLIAKTSFYNAGLSAGSPQILFRLRAYEKLKEISGFHRAGFSGWEDVDTVYRLIYHFGSLQDGLLLENKGNLYTPSALTTDRLAESDSGVGDSFGRKFEFSKYGIRDLTEDLGQVFSLRTRIMGLIESQPSDKQQTILDVLSGARNHFENRQRVQQRFNRLVLNTFLDALDKDYIKFSNGQLETKDNELAKLRGGKALLNYLRTNHDLVGDVLSSRNDLVVIRYLLGRLSQLPQNFSDLSPFQLAIREYIGNVEPFDRLINENVITAGKKAEEVPYGETDWQTTDLREKDSQISLMHSAIAELMALGHVYKTFFQTSDFLKTRNPYFWPENPEEQKLEMEFGDQQSRLQQIKENINTVGTEIPKVQQIRKEDFLSRIKLKSIPMFELFKSLSRKRN